MSEVAQLEMREIGLAAEGTDPSKAPLDESPVSWSYSKRNALEQCPRRYYFGYYGHSSRVALAEPAKPLLRKLKFRQNRYERSGEIAHDLIADALRNPRRFDAFNPDRLEREARRLWHAAVDQSKTPEPPNLSRLIEVVRNLPDAEPLLQATEERLVAALRSFATAEAFGCVRSAAGHESCRIERRFSVALMDCRVTGVVDFAARTKELPGIVDWKTGAVDPADDSLQLAVYALWAEAEYQSPPDQVRVFKADLTNGKLVSYTLSATTIQSAKARILLDLERMTSVHAYAADAVKDAFSPCAQPRVCGLCPFLDACPEGKECVA